MTGDTVIVTGNLATGRRTIEGALGHMELLGVNDDEARAVFEDQGLPRQALQEPDFPVSRAQELEIYRRLISMRDQSKSIVTHLFSLLPDFGLDSLGVLGLLMRHAASITEALHVCLEFPQLTSGHSRLVAIRNDRELILSFTMTEPKLRDSDKAAIGELTAYCVLTDLLFSLRNIECILDRDCPPVRIELPLPQPGDFADLNLPPPCEVRFNCEAARLVYPASLELEPLPLANRLRYRSYKAIADKLALMMAEEINMTQRVARWLWACCPPMSRGEIARQLAMSERSLTRRLRGEGRCFRELVNEVQSERARHLLSRGELTISEISERLGYADPAAFSRAFSKWSGASPLNWRQLHQSV